MPIGTARMAGLCLPEAQIHKGIDFDSHAEVRALFHARPQPFVLFPGPNAVDAAELARTAHEPATLIVIDGTWAQARKLIKLNPALSALPQIGFNTQATSGYQIRKQPAAHCLSTIEALTEVLGILEGDSEAYQALKKPFAAMVQTQVHHSTNTRAIRGRRKRRQPRPTPGVNTVEFLRMHAQRLVVVQGEASGWPHDMEKRPDPELLYWGAHRPSSRQRFESLVRPQQRLPDSLSANTQLSASQLEEGATLPELNAQWRAVSEPDDIWVAWGIFHAELARKRGLAAPDTLVDLRVVASRILKRRPGTIDACLNAFQVGCPWCVNSCRARCTSLSRPQRRLAQAVHLVRHLLRQSSDAIEN